MSNPRWLVISVIISMLPPVALALQEISDETLLKRPVNARLSNVTSSHALLSSLQRAGLPGGVATMWRCTEPFSYELIPAGPSMRDALEAIVLSDPQYRWEISNGVVNLLSRDEIPLMNLRLTTFEIEPTNIDESLERLLALPEVRRRQAELDLGPRLLLRSGIGYFDQKQFDNSVAATYQNITFREALNAIVRAHGQARWAYWQGGCDGRNMFEITIAGP